MGKKNVLSKIDLINTDKRASNADFTGLQKENIEMVRIERLQETPENLTYFENLPADEYENLKSDIEKNGILTPLIITDDYGILAGHQRFKIAKELNLKSLPCVIRTFKSKEEKEIFLITDNLLRRHLTKEQKAKLIIKLENDLGIKHIRGNPNFFKSAKMAQLDESITNQTIKQIEKIKKQSGISERTMKRARAKLRENENPNPIKKKSRTGTKKEKLDISIADDLIMIKIPTNKRDSFMKKFKKVFNKDFEIEILYNGEEK